MKENETVVPPGLENKIANNRKNMKEKKCETICISPLSPSSCTLPVKSIKIVWLFSDPLRNIFRVFFAKLINQVLCVKCLNFASIKQVSYSIYAKIVESMTVCRHVNVRTNKHNPFF